MPRFAEEAAASRESGPLVVVISDRADWHARELSAALKARGARVARVDLAACGFDSRHPSGLAIPGLDGALPDAVLVRTISTGTFEAITLRLGILHALGELGVLVWNSARAIERCVDKSTTSFLVARHGIPTPPTWTVESSDAARAICRQETGPLVLKPLFGSQGKGLRLIRSMDDLPEPDAVSGVYYLQQYQAIETDGFRDFRLLVVRGRVIAAMMRHAATWITNVKQGGRPVVAVPDDDMRNLAVAATRAVGASFAGVDILLGAGGRPTILEVNSMPAWSGLQNVTTRNIAAIIISDLIDEIDARCRNAVTT